MNNTRILPILLIVLFFEFIACSHQKNDRCYEFNKRYSKVVSQLGKTADTFTLINVLNEIIRAENKCIDAYLTRGDLYFMSNELDMAKADYRRAYILDTGNVYALYKMGLAFQYQDSYDSSIYFLHLATSKKSHGGFLVDYNKGVGGAAIDSDKYDVESTELLYSQAVSSFYKSDFKGALNNFDFCIQNQYKLSRSFLYRGAIYLTIGNERKACEDFFQARLNGNADADIYIRKFCNK